VREEQKETDGGKYCRGGGRRCKWSFVVPRDILPVLHCSKVRAISLYKKSEWVLKINESKRGDGKKVMKTSKGTGSFSLTEFRLGRGDV